MRRPHRFQVLDRRLLDDLLTQNRIRISHRKGFLLRSFPSFTSSRERLAKNETRPRRIERDIGSPFSPIPYQGGSDPRTPHVHAPGARGDRCPSPPRECQPIRSKAGALPFPSRMLSTLHTDSSTGKDVPFRSVLPFACVIIFFFSFHIDGVGQGGRVKTRGG